MLPIYRIIDIGDNLGKNLMMKYVDFDNVNSKLLERRAHLKFCSRLFTVNALYKLLTYLFTSICWLLIVSSQGLINIGLWSVQLQHFVYHYIADALAAWSYI